MLSIASNKLVGALKQLCPNFKQKGVIMACMYGVLGKVSGGYFYPRLQRGSLDIVIDIKTHLDQFGRSYKGVNVYDVVR